MKKLKTIILTLLLVAAQSALAVTGIGLNFNRTGSDAQSVAITVIDENGAAIAGATATLSASHAFKETANAVTDGILCPNVNGNTNPTIELTFSVSGVPAGFSFSKAALDIHAFNAGGNYQENSDGVARQWNVEAAVNGNSFGSLNDIDIAAGVGSAGNVHKVWEIEGATVECNGNFTVKLTITKGSSNSGCFFGLGALVLTTEGATPAPEPEPEPEPEPSEGEGLVYLISWKNTGGNYITEENDHRLTVQSRDNTKPQFWMFIPTENENCYYIKNTATGRYIGSCNLNPSSASKVQTSTTPVEYFVKRTSATTGEKANCHWFSSTDCANYSNESAEPRALNKDGASDYVITWKAGNDVGSYWKLIETEDLYEIRPFEGSAAIGQIGASYNVEAADGRMLTFANGKPALAAADAFDENQEWYFVGNGNATGWQIASASEPALVVGLENESLVVASGLDTKWKVNVSKEKNGYFYFTSGDKTLEVEGETLFRFTRLRSAFSRKLQIYNNPCGTVGNNYIKRAWLHGSGVTGTIVYESQSKPADWHVVYAADKGELEMGGEFEFDVTLASNAAADLEVDAHFDWNSDGVFETVVPFTIDGNTAKAKGTVPEWASEKTTRVRVRVNSNALPLAEDDVEGFIYDCHVKVVDAQPQRTVTLGVNSWERGKVTLMGDATAYDYGTTLTAKAEAYGTARFVCWREEGVVVSTNAEYTFTVDHNVKLVAYFSPNTDESSYPTAVEQVAATEDIAVEYDGRNIVANGGNINSIAVYTIDAALLAKANGNSIAATDLRKGVYIVSVTTASGYKNVKIFINK